MLRLLQGRLGPTEYEQAAADPLLYALFATFATGAFFGWRRSLPVANLWQSGVIAVLSVVGALLLGFLAWPLDRWMGLAGLAIWLVLTATFGVLGSRWSTRGATGEGP